MVPVRVLSGKNMTGVNVLRRDKKFSHTHMAESWFLLGAPFKVAESRLNSLKNSA